MAIYRSSHSSSTNLEELQYNSSTKILRVLFKSRYLYFFYDCPKYIWKAIANESPKGGKLAWKILFRVYPYRRINRSGNIGDTDYDLSMLHQYELNSLFTEE
jgi:hypothetical protein